MKGKATAWEMFMKEQTKKAILIGVAAICACLLIIGGIRVYSIMKEYRSGENAYTNLEEFVATPVPQES